MRPCLRKSVVQCLAKRGFPGAFSTQFSWSSLGEEGQFLEGWNCVATTGPERYAFSGWGVGGEQREEKERSLVGDVGGGDLSAP